jgi:excinuclease ABC subunit C
MGVTADHPRAVAAALPCSPGVYRFRDERGRILYIGRATELRRRVLSYWGDLGDRRHLARMVPRIASVEAVICASAHEAAWLERNLLEQHLPRWNRTRGGGENPVYIRMDTRPASPGLRSVHEVVPADGTHHFGPYLGGLRVRQAVAGLHRALPLPYTGTRLSGSERDMARQRGVCHADRVRLVEMLSAVLGREPAPVAAARAELRALRDRAATRQAFEVAGQIQDQLEAFDWVTCTQRVTTADPLDFDVSGWAAGHLVRFQVRSGRLDTWTARGCGQGTARRYLATTPPDWVPFAQQNADLAAALTGKTG